jgi:tRNA(Ile)-lysidine synthase
MKIEEVNKKIKQLVGEGDYKYLLTVSGGADSIAMLDVFASLNLDFVVAHCNFNLRADESDRDEAHVINMCAKYGKHCVVKSFDTEAYAEKHSISIEMAARDLRYSWFHSLRKEHSCDYIVVAHHMGDVAETIFINMLRGTGLRGLSGIAEIAGRIIRPFLAWGRDDILYYLRSKNVEYCNDSTNDTTDYVRNKIRHNIIPHFQDINPSFLKTMFENSQRMAEAELLYLAKVQELRLEITSYRDNGVIINIKALKNCLAPSSLLFEILKDYSFSSKIIDDILECLDGLSGKYFLSPTHKLVKDREELIIYPLLAKEFESIEFSESILFPINLKIEYFHASEYVIPRDKNIACFDADLIKMLLLLRKWREGDIFHPFGMKGKKKKVSDYFSDNKFSLKDKEDSFILESDSQILWIVSHRTDDRFRITKSTKRVIQLSYID